MMAYSISPRSPTRQAIPRIIAMIRTTTGSRRCPIPLEITGEQEKVRARQVLALEWDELLTMLYPPSLPADRAMDTLAAHEHCCALLILANAPLSVIHSEVATFRAIFSADDMEVLFQLFKKGAGCRRYHHRAALS